MNTTLNVMDGKIYYLNTDLELASADDLTSLAAELNRRGVYSLSVGIWENDGLWHANMETDEQYTEPEQTIAAMLTAIESLDRATREAWNRCSHREFNIGYDCGDEPWAFNQGLSRELLKRVASTGASIRITIYPDRDDRNSRESDPPAMGADLNRPGADATSQAPE